MKPTVFNYQEYERVVEENKKLNAEVADLRIRCRTAESDKRDCKSCKHHKADGCSRWECEYEPVKSDLIRRQDAIDALNKEYHGMLSDESMKIYQIKNWLSALPSADAVEVVRCKECKHCRWDGFASKICRLTDMTVEDECYCWWGERRKP